MDVITVQSSPFDGQKPGTSGLRKKTAVFEQAHYLENFVEAIWQAIGGAEGRAFVVGGDGRHHNDHAAQVILKMAAAAGASRVIVGCDALLSTPAASHLIRSHGTYGGIVLSASHNPGGPDEDFGIKYNTENGGPAPQEVTDRIHDASKAISAYRIVEAPDVDLSTPGIRQLGDMSVEVVDPVEAYAELMAGLFDFAAIARWIGNGGTLRYDAMNAVTGPYAKAIIEGRLGAPEGSVVNAEPLPDFGGLHPDPNPTWAKELVECMMSADGPDFGAASDGDGDRNLILGRGVYVTPSDSVAVLAANATVAPGYAKGLAGVARSMPTSRALDKVAEAAGYSAYETPTGWKFFGNLLDAGKVTICGEESNGTGSDHVREKDGLWAVLFWLNILAARRASVAEVMRDHWREYGRTFYSRHDYEGVDSEKAEALIDSVRGQLSSLPGQLFAGRTVSHADEFSYDDPVDGSHAAAQGLRIHFEGGGRSVLRLSGTGTSGATLRVYLEDEAGPDDDIERDPQEALASIIAATEEIARIREHTGRHEPDVRT